ncbi:hypothetical protein [Mycobacterium botniense]|jgi:hypothetical protein|uniref:Uncharacterized protein n=1 Tax=Mycobacterium botniense TaxID=84962 RepID=A0A7I9XX36_9MYCO|nr:hypothetical protein [Mycobacterium botniense]GFG74317.1 hypothetical protein MBOT_16820 [Mycobacterium botniense]
MKRLEGGRLRLTGAARGNEQSTALRLLEKYAVMGPPASPLTVWTKSAPRMRARGERFTTAGTSATRNP